MKKTTSPFISNKILFGFILFSALSFAVYQNYRGAMVTADINVIAPPTVLYTADFGKMEPITSSYHANFFKLYSQNNSAIMELPVSSGTAINSLNYGLPFVNPTNSNYKIDFDVTILESSNYNVWVRLISNYSTSGQFTISLHPGSSAYEIRRILNGNNEVVVSGVHKSIKKNGELNHVTISRYPIVGLLTVSVNGEKVAEATDKTLVGGKNLLMATSYSGKPSKIKYSNFVISSMKEPVPPIPQNK